MRTSFPTRFAARFARGMTYNRPMKPPKRLLSLVEEGLIDTVVLQLMSGKEAEVYVVRSGDDTLCAKVYKEATQRSFRQAVDYTENRKTKNSRQARAMAKGTKFGRQAQEAAWQSAEVDALYRLAAAGVRVPAPHNFLDGVLLMELVTDEHGEAAPRLNDVMFTPEQARAHHAMLLLQVVRMLCAGVVHGDLSEFNILLSAHGPVIIDLPQAVDYTENRKTKNSRQARAMAKGTKYGRESQEAAWQSAEVDALYRLAAAGVRVPAPHNFLDGVLLMEMVADANGEAAPRLNDVMFTPAEARAHHAMLLLQVVRMLCAGVVHGDLSEFNILLGADGPVIIDLPQAVDAAGNNHAQRMLLRDVVNLRDFFGRFAPEILHTDFGPEIWDLYQRGELTTEAKLTGTFERELGEVDIASVMREIDDARAEEAARLLRMQTAE